MFPKHQYGTQTVIGTIEHLKNPSIKEIITYFNTYYKPNNVAICLSGDLDYDATIAQIDKYFGKWQSNDALTAWKKLEEPLLCTSRKRSIWSGCGMGNVCLSFWWNGE